MFCLTPGNLVSPWIAFEAGALASQDQGRVMTFLHRVTATDVKPPLGLFQATNSSAQEDVYLLLKSLNSRCSPPLREERLLQAFEQNWPSLQTSLKSIADVVPTKPQQKDPDAPELLKEILAVVRRIEKDGQISVSRTVENLGLGSSGGIISGGAYRVNSGLLSDANAGALTQAARVTALRKAVRDQYDDELNKSSEKSNK